MLDLIRPKLVNRPSQPAIKWPQAIALIWMGSLVVFGLSACGKKPGQVDPPPGVSKNSFPSVYPDPATDPK